MKKIANIERRFERGVIASSTALRELSEVMHHQFERGLLTAPQKRAVEATLQKAIDSAIDMSVFAEQAGTMLETGEAMMSRVPPPPRPSEMPANVYSIFSVKRRPKPRRR